MPEKGADLPIHDLIYEIRGQRVMLDSDLAQLYEVPTHRLNQAVKRNTERFPNDFMFQLTDDEWNFLISQIVISKNSSGKHIPDNSVIQPSKKRLNNLILQIAISKDNRGGRRFLPYVFTEQGVAMLSSVLGSKKAIDVNISIMRAFVNLRRYVITQGSTSTSASEQIAELRKLLLLHIENSDYKISEHDEAIKQIIVALNKLLEISSKPKRRIGFNAEKGD